VPPDELLGGAARRIAYRNRRKELEAAALIPAGLMAVRIPNCPSPWVSGANAPCTEIGGDFSACPLLTKGLR